ncbi:hypothetical protein ACS0TY_034922 [Phlomoides rotata]
MDTARFEDRSRKGTSRLRRPYDLVNMNFRKVLLVIVVRFTLMFINLQLLLRIGWTQRASKTAVERYQPMARICWRKVEVVLVVEEIIYEIVFMLSVVLNRYRNTGQSRGLNVEHLCRYTIAD